MRDIFTKSVFNSFFSPVLLFSSGQRGAYRQLSSENVLMNIKDANMNLVHKIKYLYLPS